ncbi:hypothetical protein [Actinomadura chokoriensis]|uniref:Uncharacterized protein n=1 Tax=Actinomadura chokoriensis TaxID=454156 RepID=A0ABV4QUJ2_9ACTN
MIKTLHKWGLKSDYMYTAGLASIGLAFASWAASNRYEAQGLERADRWGIFVGEWAPTFFAMGVALRMEEIRDRATEDVSRARDEMRERAPRSAAMR